MEFEVKDQIKLYDDVHVDVFVEIFLGRPNPTFRRICRRRKE